MKHRMDDDFVVCEYIKGNYLTSIVLEQFRERELVYKSHMTLGVSGEAFAVIKTQPQRPELPFSQPSPASHGRENAVWLEPELVCVVAFMHRTKSSGMRQPVFKGLRLDKLPLDCVEAS